MLTFIPRGILITGTDTGVGKTETVCALLRCAAIANLAVRAMKPIASGAELHADGHYYNDDALRIQALTPDLAYALVNPFCLQRAIAPHLAARQEARELSLDLVISSYQQIAQNADLVLVEGAGGFMSPLHQYFDDTWLDHTDLANSLAIRDVLLVVGMRLGCINHARLSMLAIKAEGFRCVGWIASVLDPNMPALDANIESLKSLLDAPLLTTFHASDDCSMDRALRGLVTTQS